MESKQDKISDYDHPVAYDAQNRPLYARPANAQPNSVHVTRPVEPAEPYISDSTRLKHNRSKKLFPNLNLSEGEYVISSVRRHSIGIILPLGLGTLIITLLFIILFNYDLVLAMFQVSDAAIDLTSFVLVVFGLIVIALAITYFAYYIFSNNKIYLTNESIFQVIQTGLFKKREQTISLGNVEDASYSQSNIIQKMLDYGSIRLSTVGSENTYRLTFVAKPKEQIDVLNNAVEAFKNGRPVEKS